MSVIEIDRVNLSFGGLKALDDLSFHVDREEIFSIIGPNGAGKTSLFNCISGFYTPSAGTIKFEGKILNNLKPHNITKLGLIRTFQNLRLFGDMTVEENVMTSLYCRHKSNVFDALLHTRRYHNEEKDAREVAHKYLRLVGLNKISGRLVKKLPYGVQKRLEIARALAIEPKVVMLDEPAAGLNHEEKEALMRIIGEIKKMGITVLLIEHDMGLVMRISERIIVLNYGRKIAEGSPQEIRDNQEVVEAYLGREN
jgi:branched-chain amino acid transport system ATP-binding protein